MCAATTVHQVLEGPLWGERRLSRAGEPVDARPSGRAGAVCERARRAEAALSTAGVAHSRMGFFGVSLCFAPWSHVRDVGTYKVVVTTPSVKVGYQCT